MSSSPPRERRATPLTTRLVAAIVTLLALVLVAFSLATLGLAARDLDRRLDEQVHQAAGRSMGYARPQGDRRDPLDAPGQGADVLTVVAVDGTVTNAGWRGADGTTSTLPPEDVAVLQGAGALDASDFPRGDQQPGTLRTVRLSIGEYRVESRRLPARGADASVVVVTGLPTATVRDPVAALAVTQGLGILAALALAGVLSTLIIRRALRPLERVSGVAGHVAALPLDTPHATLPADRVPAELAVPGTEVGDVGAALNHLLDNVGTALVARQRSEQSLREFVADASHELRTPLAAVRGYSDLVRLTEELTPDGRAALERVDSQAQRMGGLVDDLLLLARLDTGQHHERRVVDLNEVVIEAVLDAQAAGREHHWEVRVPDDASPVDGDPRQLEQVVANLLSNARKHTPVGTRVLAAVSHVDGDVVVSVTDDGPGVPAELQPRIFDRFSRGDTQRAATNRAEGSTGLGLSIVRAVVEAHGGSVELDSAPGRTTFTVRLPLA